jgi:hypothetical protein
VSYVRGFLFFWYDFLVGDAWDIAAGVVVALVVLAIAAAAAPAAAVWLGPLLAVAVVALTWMSVRREARRR